jgi:capsular exopolysaccharide synthesis family protein
MNAPDQKKRFKLGDILRKLNEENAAARGARDGEVDDEAAASDARRENNTLLTKPDISLPEQPRFGGSAGRGDDDRPAAPAVDERLHSGNEAPRPDASVPAPSHIEKNAGTPGSPAGAGQSPPRGPDTLDAGEEAEEFDIYRYLSLIYRRKGIIALTIFVFTAVSLYTYLTGGKYYTAHARMLFNPGYQEIISDNVISFEAWGSREKKLNTHLNPLKTNQEVLHLVCTELGGDVTPGVIQSSLVIERGNTGGEKNDIIELKFSNRNAELARDVLNSLCRTYINYILEVNAQDITKMVMKFSAQIDKIKDELREKEDRLRVFKEQNRMVHLSTETEGVVSKLSGMEAELQQTELAMIESKDKFAILQKQISQQDIEIVQSVTYEDPYRKRLGELEFEKNISLAEYSPDHFKIQKIQQEIDRIKDILKSNVNKSIQNETTVRNPVREQLRQDLVSLTIERSSLEAKQSALQEVIKKLNDEVVKLPLLEQQYATLERETQALDKAEQMLEDQYEKIKIKRDSQESDLKMLEWAQMPTRAFMNVKSSRVFMGMLMGLIIGVALAFLLEYLDQTIKEIKDVERILEVPLLGVVPFIEGENTVLEIDSKKWKNKLEPFRSLRANLKHIATANKLQTFMICSAVKGEGKTTLAVNMAITFAMDGKRVIVIDGDLRRPQIHTLLGVAREPGLSDYLLDSAEISQVIKPTRYDNLFVITSGERPHNPAELIGTVRFDQLLLELAGRADYVFLDTPALLPVSDAITMAPKIKAGIMVTRSLWTPVKAARHARAQLKQINIPVVGAILNGVSHARGYYPYYYGYYRYYAYKYTYDYDEDRKERFSWREFGLGIEEKLRSGLLNVRGSFPRYLASGGRHLRGVMRHKTFWALLLAFLAISFAAPWLKEKKAANAVPGIQYLEGKNAVRPAPAGMPLEAVRRSAASDSVPPADTLAAGGAPAYRAPDALFSGWLNAARSRDAAAALMYYDTLNFRYPGGGISEWRTFVHDSLFSNTIGAGILRVDSSDIAAIDSSVANATAALSAIDGQDTSRVQIVQLWQKNSGTWRIVREKHRRIE